MLGFITTLACMSTSHNSDYVVNVGHLQDAGGEMWEWLTTAACKTGLLTRLRSKVNGVGAWKVIDDPDFIHIILKAEKDWKNQQRADTNNLAISVPVRLRDGDLCRYCGVMTYWTGGNSKSTRQGTLDHTEGRDVVATAGNIVVSCLGCNCSLKDEPQARRPLMPPPLVPFYSPYTAKWLTRNGYPTKPTASDPSSDPHPADNALNPRDSRPGNTALIPSQRPAPADNARPAPPAHPPPLNATERSVLTDDQVDDSRVAGSGRVGSGAGSAGSESGSRRRRHRGRRGRSRPASTDLNP